MSLLAILAASLAYAVAGLVCARLIAGHLAYRFWERSYKRFDGPDGEQWLGAWLIGLAVGVVWPLALLISKINFTRFAVGAEAREIQRRQAQRITDLERQAGIR
jgi:hypothetical protein